MIYSDIFKVCRRGAEGGAEDPQVGPPTLKQHQWTSSALGSANKTDKNKGGAEGVPNKK